MATGFKLVPKLDRNKAVIYLVLPDGSYHGVAWFCFVDDFQAVDNVETLKEILPILRKRFKNSL